MQRHRQMQIINKRSIEPSFNNTPKPFKPQAPTIKQLIQLDTVNTTNRLTSANSKLLDLIDTSNRNYLIKYPINHQHNNHNMKQSASFNLIQSKCNCHENDYDEINSFSEEDYSDYDHLNISATNNDTNSNHYLQPSYNTMRKTQFSSRHVTPESNYYHLYRKNSNVSRESVPPPIPRSKLPTSDLKPYTVRRSNQELLNKSFTSSSLSSDKIDSQLFLSPISSGYNSSQDILKSDYYYYENEKLDKNVNLSNDYNCIDSGFSTLNMSARTSDEDEDASSHVSPYYSSPSTSSSISSINQNIINSDDQINMIQASPFPRVNTSFVAQIKQINTSSKTKLTKEPIYENLRQLNTTQTNHTTKQYSLNDIYNSLKSLDLNVDSHVSRTVNRLNKSTKKQIQHVRQRHIDYNDVLCDQEVEFYLSNSNNNILSLQSNDSEFFINNSSHKNIPNRINAFWEQLV